MHRGRCDKLRTGAATLGPAWGARFTERWKDLREAKAVSASLRDCSLGALTDAQVFVVVHLFKDNVANCKIMTRCLEARVVANIPASLFLMRTSFRLT